MKNSDRIEYALGGYLVGGAGGFATMPFFVLAGINPSYWFMLVIFICGPIGAWLGWHYTDAIDEWMNR